MHLDDTITAISTPPGEGGIGIIRISGENALLIGEKVFVSVNDKKLGEMDSYTMAYGYIKNPKTKEILDEVIVSVMLAPKTYTRENIIEINCHGGVIAVKRILELVLENGARLAEPGEFARRAFVNGRIDLAQAEATIDVIRSQTEKSLQSALGQLEGGLSRKIQELREMLIFMLAHLEASIDFPEEDIEEMEYAELLNRGQELDLQLERMLSLADQGKIIREGLKTAIIGRPNVGKSSLLNALLQEKRAIVTDIPGTTRDAIEEVVNVRGIPVKIIDTAGIRETDDLVEQIGVDKAKEYLDKADLVLFLLNNNESLSQQDEEIFALLKNKKKIILLNKTDLEGILDRDEVIKRAEGAPIVELSLKEEKGLEELASVLESLFFSGSVEETDQIMVTNVRHKNLLQQAKSSLQEALNALNTNLSPDLVSIDLKNTLFALGEITGETVSDDIMDKIFSQFCLGK